MTQTDKSRQTVGKRYPIRTVSELTGINPITLRAWERRYGLITPERTVKGHRLYSENDIQRIREVQALLDEGLAISRVADALEQSVQHAADPWIARQQQMLKAVQKFDERALEQVYGAALALYPVDTVTEQLLLPLLKILGVRWESGEGSVAEEHFFSTYMRNKLGARFHHRSDKAGPTLVLAGLPGDQHELGLLLFALAVHEAGYRIILLGADTPVAGLNNVAQLVGAKAMVLAGSRNVDKSCIEKQLPELVSQCPVPVLIGGQVSDTYRDELDAMGAVPLGASMAAGLNRLRKLCPVR